VFLPTERESGSQMLDWSRRMPLEASRPIMR